MFWSFNPYAASNKCSSLIAANKKHENIKRYAYGQQIWDAYFFMSATSGLAHEVIIFYTCLTSLLSTKWWDSYAFTLCFCLCFLLLWSATTRLFGAQSLSVDHNRNPPPMDLVRVESQLTD